MSYIPSLLISCRLVLHDMKTCITVNNPSILLHWPSNYSAISFEGSFKFEINPDSHSTFRRCIKYPDKHKSLNHWWNWLNIFLLVHYPYIKCPPVSLFFVLAHHYFPRRTSYCLVFKIDNNRETSPIMKKKILWPWCFLIHK